MTTEHAEHVILACCVLHNYLRTKTVESQQLADTIAPDGSVTGGSWREDNSNRLPGIRRTISRNPTQSAIDVRDKLVGYFSTEGRLPWQDTHVCRT